LFSSLLLAMQMLVRLAYVVMGLTLGRGQSAHALKTSISKGMG
jgi:hypothetical protein